MIILCDYKFPQTNKTTWIKFNGRRVERYEPEEIPAVISDLIDQGNNEHVYIKNMSMYASDLLDILYLKCYSPVKGNPPVKKMKNNTFKYLINGDFNAYSITTVKKRNNTMHFVNANNMLAINTDKTIIETWTGPEDGDEPERLARGFYRAISGVLRDIGAEKQLPVTISGACRRAWNKSLDGQIFQMLKNANKTKIAGESLEKYCRRAYHGGLCLNNSKVDDNIQEGMVLDVNSLYPYIMKNYPMPRGEARYETGKPPKKLLRDAKDGYVYFFVEITASFDLKPDGIPCVQISSDNRDRYLHKKGWLISSKVYDYFNDKYIDNPEYDKVTLTLTQTDLGLFFENYDIRALKFNSYVWFPTTTYLFENYVDRYFKEKQEATSSGERRIKKMMLNGLSGNMARLPEYENINIIETPTGFRYEHGTSEGSKSYVYVGGAITSYARKYLIDHIKKVKDRWLYSDTDSIHLKGKEIPEGFEISDALGAWKVEKEFDHVVYYGRKMYGYHNETGYHFTLAGIGKEDALFFARILNGMSEEEAIEGLDIVQPSIYRLSDIESEAIDHQFTNELDDGDYQTLQRLEKRAGRRSRKAYYIYNVVAKKKDPLKAFYFCKLPITIKNHGREPFTETKTITWKQLSDIEILY